MSALVLQGYASMHHCFLEIGVLQNEPHKLYERHEESEESLTYDVHKLDPEVLKRWHRRRFATSHSVTGLSAAAEPPPTPPGMRGHATEINHIQVYSNP